MGGRDVARGWGTLRTDATGDAPPDFVCLHGLVDSRAVWDRVTPALAERGRVIRVDQRGHGSSDAPAGPCAREDLAADVVAVLNAWAVPRAILVGHSMGGIVAMTTALAHPERVAGLVLIGTASQSNERTAGWYERIARAGEEEGLAGLVRSIYGARSSKTIEGDAPGIAQVTRALKSLYTDPLTQHLSAIDCPALLLVGEKDPMGPKASHIIAGELPRATLEVVPGGGHWTHVESPGLVIDAIDRWRKIS